MPNLKWLNIALQARWPWLHRSDTSRPWNEFTWKVPEESLALSRAAAHTTVGDGETALFWEDRWISGWRMQEMAPKIYNRVQARTRASRSVKDGVEGALWARDVRPDLELELLQEYFLVWEAVEQVTLRPGIRDQIRWAWEKDGQFSARSAYAAKFCGREVAPAADFTWKSNAPLQCRFFTWLAFRDRCWTSDRLARRGLPHQDSCPFCNQHEESIQHLLLRCVFAKEVWHNVCEALGRQDWTPSGTDVLTEWCITKNDNGHRVKDIRAIMVLVMWCIWKQRNDIVFEGATPSIPRLARTIEREGRSWRTAGLLKGDLDLFFSSLSWWVARSS